MQVLRKALDSPEPGSLSAQWWNDSRSFFLLDMLAPHALLQGPSMDDAWCCKGRARHHVHARPVGFGPFRGSHLGKTLCRGRGKGLAPRSNQLWERLAMTCGLNCDGSANRYRKENRQEQQR
jgi:hypothetical protein